jgi:hypothetical protein
VSVRAHPVGNSLTVQTRNHYGVLSDAEFHLMVAC